VHSKHRTSYNFYARAFGFFIIPTAFSFSFFINPKTSLSMANATPFISYHQFLARPVLNSICTSPPPSSQSKRRPLREEVLIKHPNVHDLSYNRLWQHICQSLDTFSHNIAQCTCCRGKGPSLDEMSERNFVLVLCGDLRDQSPSKQSWL
jgi:hypothetical protein